MRLSHLALTVIDDPDHEGAYLWLLLEAQGDDVVHAHSASEESYPSALEAFDAGTARWKQQMRKEDEDADPVGDNVNP
ncbi:hypothetical protein [Variovorax sp. ZT4R33]|uniref:hypothetical protein n=1 Tax=Variovorax sp. ZT4R33 TaxID=3443743 RepID=UPI003F455F35